MEELERTFLVKYIPKGLEKCRYQEIIDLYFPKTSLHPKLRLRKHDDRYELTKKEPLKEGDASHQEEQTVLLTNEEFEILNRVEGKRTHKIRYYYDYQGRIAEFDDFLDELKGLVIVDFEFRSKKTKDCFQMPDFCLADVTQEVFLAGGMVCGKSYQDLVKHLKRFHYQKLFIKEKINKKRIWHEVKE